MPVIHEIPLSWLHNISEMVFRWKHSVFRCEDLRQYKAVDMWNAFIMSMVFCFFQIFLQLLRPVSVPVCSVQGGSTQRLLEWLWYLQIHGRLGPCWSEFTIIDNYWEIDLLHSENWIHTILASSCFEIWNAENVNHKINLSRVGMEL